MTGCVHSCARIGPGSVAPRSIGVPRQLGRTVRLDRQHRQHRSHHQLVQHNDPNGLRDRLHPGAGRP